MGCRSRIACCLAVLAFSGCMPAQWGADALLYPSRRTVGVSAPAESVNFDVGIALRGWRFRTTQPRRGTLIYLHGVASNRGSSRWIAPHFLARGFDVVAYDGRAHGESGGEACTYGFHERQDLAKVIDALGVQKVLVMGSSLGAAVALQAAAHDPRIAGVIAVATFSDLRTVANERAPFFASQGNIDEALRIAEQKASFRVDDVSPVALAPRIRVPVFLVHGADDDETPAAHSKRVYDALTSRKRLTLVPKAGHNDSMKPEVWAELGRWLDQTFGTAPLP